MDRFPDHLRRGLRLPMIGAPLFLISCPKLVIAQCTSGVIGSLPALNARPATQLDEWLSEITEALAAWDRLHPERPAAPFAINQVVHKTNPRLEEDLELCQKYRVPIVISSMGARADVNAFVQAYGGFTFHDVIDDRFARKAIEKGANGLIAVAAGAGGHAGAVSPFALMGEIRAWFEGPVALSGAIASGAGILAAEAMGADLAYVGSAFIATHEANAGDAQKQGVVAGRASDILYTDFFTGVAGNYLRPSILAAGYDPDALPASRHQINIGVGAAETAKAWRDIWGCGQGIGAIDAIMPASALIDRLTHEYSAALARLKRLAV